MSEFKTLKKKIFCIEGDWENDLRKKSSIVGILDLLHKVNNVEYIQDRNCSTKQEFISRLNQFKESKYKTYNILYLAFHGSSSTIHLGSETIDLDEIQEILQDSLQGKIIYFGSCKTLKIKKEKINEFVDITKANCLVGYTKDIDFIEGTALDLLFFAKAQQYFRPKNLTKNFKNSLSSLISKQGLIIETN